MSNLYTGQMPPAPPPVPTVTGQLINDVRPFGAASGTAAAVAQTAWVIAGRPILTGIWRAATGK
ncbi:hypothetical protein [Streptomyces sporangiiformans]|uniref:Uncharacterized protein n=1 Tax=Streptomyces sporangiiformans TaxID=2315329 RepID=A0A505DEV9_9ACTN|nr:hypothetical protein [Streptomyces sporangiiformans]TPQ19138.1 hypothetical protein FGD71_027345 [Streptomyces sporangiiformans]